MKTRLIAALGAESAAGLAKAMLLDVWRTVESCPGVHPILATTRLGDFPMRVPAKDVWLQGEGDLGDRIERIIARGLTQAPGIIALGADSPALRASHLRTALDLLQAADAVVGPSTDGGFYLLAMRRCPSGLFADLPWSTAGTRRALRMRLTEHEFTIADLESLFDIDNPSDLRLLEHHLACDPSRGSATRAWYIKNRTRLAAI